MEKYYIVNHSLGGYRATMIPESSISDCGWSFGIYYGSTNYYNDGPFSVRILQNGEPTDFSINGWTFSLSVCGNYHIPGRFSSATFTLNFMDENCQKRESEHFRIDSYREEDIIAAIYDNIIKIASLNDAQEYDKIQNLRKLTSYGLKKLKVLSMIEDLTKEYNSEIENDEPNECRLDMIKQAVDHAVDILQQKLNDLRLR